MQQQAFRVLRIGLGLTFVWIAVLIWRDPVLWSGFLPLWSQSILPLAPEQFMRAAAVVDAAIGVLLLAGQWVKIVSALAALHLLGLVLTFGFTDLGARDFGLMMAAVAVFLGEEK